MCWTPVLLSALKLKLNAIRTLFEHPCEKHKQAHEDKFIIPRPYWQPLLSLDFCHLLVATQRPLSKLPSQLCWCNLPSVTQMLCTRRWSYLQLRLNQSVLFLITVNNTGCTRGEINMHGRWKKESISELGVRGLAYGDIFWIQNHSDTDCRERNKSCTPCDCTGTNILKNIL
jgi:hypothetical protein